MTQDQKEAALNCVYAYETSDVYKALQDALTELEAHKAIAASFVKAEHESVAFRTKEELADVLVPWYDREDSKNVLAEPAEQEPKCNQHPDAPHGFDRNASHNAGRYVCECERWSPDDMAYRPSGLSMEQAEQEPVVKYPGCDYCNDELFCGRKCKFCGKVFIEDEDFVQSEVKSLRKQVAALKAVVDAWKNAEQEPVAWIDLEQWQSGEYDCFTSEKVADYMTPLYAAPVRTKDLTDADLLIIRDEYGLSWEVLDFARAVIAADREKNK